MSDLVGPEDFAARERLGGKAAALAALQRAGFAVPQWFVLAPEAFYAGLAGGERQVLEVAADPAAVRDLVGRIALSPRLRLELATRLSKLCPHGEAVAVRSSACDEDGGRHSFAGQLDSFLFVRPAEVAERVVAVWRSAFGERALAYRRVQGLSLEFDPPAVLIQRMVNATVSGVAFGADPVSGRRGVAVVAAVYGLGTALVSGDCDADTYHVDREGRIIGRMIADKRWAHRYDRDSAERICRVPVPEKDATRPALDDDQIRAVTELARRAGKHFGRPQDIEWAIEDGRLCLLQSRPITSLSLIADPDGAPAVWDNSNIAESYSGVTTPLTFSFVRSAYEEVYRQFCRIMGVHAATIAAHQDMFRRMLGLIRGRIYYNLVSWYRLLAMLPGFRANRRFMEQMMGVSEALPEGLLTRPVGSTAGARLKDGLHLLLTVGRLIANHFVLPYKIKGFYRRLHAALSPVRSDLEELRADELVAYYHDLERQLLTRWDAPVINDFFAMIFFGVLRRLTASWCGDREKTLQNDLLCGEGGMVSAEPAKLMREMAQIAAADPDLVAVLCDGSLDAIRGRMGRCPEFGARQREYLEKFGDRCLEELKLETSTLHDDPLILLRSVGQLARRLSSPDHSPALGVATEVRRRAERRAQEALAGRPVRRLVFRWVLENARARVRDRENLRFERTRVFGRVRTIFVEIGRRLYALDLLEDPRDVFYLEVGEILGFVEGTTTCTDLRGLVAVRKAEFAGYRGTEVPADRFVSRGIVHQGNPFRREADASGPADGDQRIGMGCCPGVVRGPVRVITDPRNAALRAGDILVAERTDPGWVMLFPSAAALLVERGSLLSHSAIVARELGIPAVLSVGGLTRWLKDGDWVELDGSSGIVRRIERPRAGVAHAV